MRLLSLLPFVLVSTAVAAWPFTAKTATQHQTSRLPTLAELQRAEELNDDNEWILNTVDSTIIPPSLPLVKPVEVYHGTEYTFYMLKIRPNELKFEFALLVLLGVYLIVSLNGANRTRAKQWLDANKQSLKEEFAVIGLESGNLQEESGDLFLGWLSGRRAVDSCLIRLQTTPAHDVLKQLYFALRKLLDFNYDSGADTIVFDFSLQEPESSQAKFFFAAVKKTALRRLQSQRWDLLTFGEITEVDGCDDITILSEMDEVTEAMLAHYTGLMKAFAEPEGLEYFESLVISDMPEVQPENDVLPTNIWKLTLTLRLPPPGQEAATQKWFTLALNISDCLYAKSRLLSPLKIRDLKKRRATVTSAMDGPVAARMIRAAESGSEQQFMSATQQEAHQRNAAKEKRGSKKQNGTKEIEN